MLLRQVDDLAEEMVEFARDLVRIPTVNPPGDAYRECAERIASQWRTWGHEVRLVEARGLAEHTSSHPRINVIGWLAGDGPGGGIHLNGHFDVVPPGEGWTLDPFGGTVTEGRLYGRGSADMKAGIAVAGAAAEAVRRSGISRSGPLELSGTVDEETGGFAGVAYLAEHGLLDRRRTPWVIIPEPFGPDQVCTGHRGVYWFRVTAQGHTAHGSMPHRGRSAISDMAELIRRIHTELEPRLSHRISALPVVPMESRAATVNVNSVSGGQAGEILQSPCVADRCEAVIDRRFIPEESFTEVKAEILKTVKAVEAGGTRGPFVVEDLLVVHPTRTDEASPLVRALQDAGATVRGRPLDVVASPGTYDQKHVARLAGIQHCVAYGPGRLAQAHRPDEWCAVDDMVDCAKVLALTIAELLGHPGQSSP